MERIEVEEEDNSVMKLKFPLSINPGKVVLDLKDVGKSYGELEVLNQVDLMIERGDKIAFVGQNGQGKSTLARIMVGDLDHLGKVKKGHNVQLGYFAQNQIEFLDGEKTVEDTMLDAADEQTRPRVRDILGAFLFSGDDVKKYVKVLSGGERNRLALAKMLLQPFNVLIMDEPTNHLDMRSKDVLKEALNSYEGTLIVVSHDRDFLQGLSNKVYEFKDKKIKEYLGDIDYFLETRQLSNLREAEFRTTEKAVEAKSSNKLAYEEQKRLKSLKNKLSKLESKISDLESEIKKIDLDLEVNYEETIAVEGFFDQYQSKKNDLNTLMQQWEEVQMELEDFQHD